MGLTYQIFNDEIIIRGVIDKSATQINIPEYIEGYPVTEICTYAFRLCRNLEDINIPDSIVNISHNILYEHFYLKYINGHRIKNGFCLINNRFMYWKSYIYMIRYQICGDYICDFTEGEYRYFIDKKRYYRDFSR